MPIYFLFEIMLWLFNKENNEVRFEFKKNGYKSINCYHSPAICDEWYTDGSIRKNCSRRVWNRFRHNVDVSRHL